MTPAIIILGFLFLHPQQAAATLPAAALQDDAAPGSVGAQGDTRDAGDAPGYYFPIIFNDSVEAWIQHFTTRQRRTFQKWLIVATRHVPAMREIIRSRGLPEELAYLAMIESGFRAGAVSKASAVGPWQLMAGTARRYGLRVDGWVDERRDAVKATHAAARYLRDCFEQFGSWPLAIAAYNAGMRRIERAVDHAASSDFWDLRSPAYLRRETRNFVPKFMAAVLISRDPAAYGFSAPPERTLRYAEVTVPARTNLRSIARYADTSPKVIASLNPQFLKEATPPRTSSTVRIPADRKRLFLKRMRALGGMCLESAQERAVAGDDSSNDRTAAAHYAFSAAADGPRLGNRCGMTDAEQHADLLAGEASHRLRHPNPWPL